MKCQNVKCGAAVAPCNKFCGQCGQEVKIDDHEDKIKNCPRCASLQKLSQRFCTDCGFEIAKEYTCQAQTEKGPCGNGLPPNSKFCGVCGKSTNIENKKPDNKQDSSVEDKTKDSSIEDKIKDRSVEDKTPDSTQYDELDSSEQHQSAVISNPNKPKIIKDPETEEKIVMIVQKPDDEDSSTEVREDIVLKEFKGIVNSEESIKKESPARGIVVICTHTTFKKHAVNLNERQSGFDDKDLMEKSWKLYDNCEVLTFEDERNKFYDKELEEKIKEKIADIQNVKYFVFVLSTHGDERPEKENDGKVHNRHYFYTRDGQFKTQDLMNKINDMEKIDGKMKLFFIQACRSRVNNTEQENQDAGFNVGITSTIYTQSFKQETKSTDVQDATGHMLSSEKENHLSSKTIIEFEEHRMEKLTIHSESMDVQDARGYMPPPEEDNDNNMAQQPEMKNEDTEAIKSETMLIPPTEEIPHCDDCIVVFASMAGKYAYSRLHDPMAGGWMIRALHSTLNHYQGGDSVHILDILRGINREVSEKTLLTPLHNSDQCRSHLSILKDELNRELMTENYCEKSYDDLSKLSEQLDHLQNSLELKMGSDSKETRDELVKEIFEVTDSVEKIVGPVVLKAQSCFFHNLAFKDEEMILLKTKIQ